jgi:hypothetical protein
MDDQLEVGVDDGLDVGFLTFCILAYLLTDSQAFRF